MMTGREIEYVFPSRPESAPSAATGLEIQGLSLEKKFADVSFSVRAGEILGLAGLVGSGRSEILESVYGARRPSSGSVTVDGKRLRPGSGGAAGEGGVGLAPEKRKSQGLLPAQAVYRNLTMSSLRRFAKVGFLDGSAEKAAAAE